MELLVAGGVTVQLAAPGAQFGVSVSPGLYVVDGGIASVTEVYSMNISMEKAMRRRMIDC